MTISLLLGVHAHQPVGNFPAVIDDAHIKSYGMFLRVMARYPEFRFSVHFSGWLLDVLLERFPEDMALLKTMTDRGQVEWFGSGDCEPVLAAIPHRDRVTQIATLSDKIERHFGVRPQGAWLTERVWESAVVSSLLDTGIRYVAVDDYHFLCAGIAQRQLDSFHTTEEDGRCLDLFPIAEQARYRLPFSPAHETVAWLEDLSRKGHRASVYFDDIEKFGIWPETYEWVYEKGWLTQFIEGVLASPLIRTETYAAYHAREHTRGIVYLPTTSYIEMNEWTLPGPRATEYHNLVEQEKAAGRFEANKPFIRGGIWRNFMSCYPEANWMHKRMLQASARLNALPAQQRTPAMQESLHRAQANDAYWHGLFGGLYLPHLRRAIWNNLLALEADLDAVAPNSAVEEHHDIDSDGSLERVLHSATLKAYVREDCHAGLVELSSLSLAHNFGDTLQRYPEAYHEKLGQQQTPSAESEGITSAHDRIAFRHEILPGDAEPDIRPRGLFLERLVAANGNSTGVENYHADSAPGVYIAQGKGWRLEKRYEVVGSTLTVTLRLSGKHLPAHLQTEINLAMPSCDGFGGRYLLPDGEVPCGFGQELKRPALAAVRLEDSELRGAVALAVSPAPTFLGRPHLTVSQSEAGFEKIMQATCLILSWPAIAGEYRITLTVEPAPAV
jgi:hypothetical protein